MIFTQAYNPGIRILVSEQTNAGPTHLHWNHDHMSAAYWRLYWAPFRHFRIILNNVEFHPEPACLALIPPHTPFNGRCDIPLRQFLIHFTARSPFDHLRPEIFMIQVNSLMRDYINEMTKEMDQASVDELRVINLSIALVQITLLKIPRDRLQFHPSDQRVIEAIETIDSGTSHSLTVESLARHAGLNINSFIRLFKQHTGFTPQQYSIRKRIEKAGLLLEQTQLSIDEIAEETGFCHRHHFTHCFTAIQGLSPAAYRKKTW